MKAGFQVAEGWARASGDYALMTQARRPDDPAMIIARTVDQTIWWLVAGQ